MVEVLSRCGKAIISSHKNGEIPSHNAQIMLSVIHISLNVLSQISQTASFVLSSFRHDCSTTKLKIRSDDYHKPIMAREEHLSTISACDPNFIDEFLQEMQVQASLGSSQIDCIAKEYRNEEDGNKELSQDGKNGGYSAQLSHPLIVRLSR
jgi:hypothetical protein